MTTVEFVVRAHLLSKVGEKLADCEDALAVACDMPGRGLRAAVADGAGSSAFSGYWAALLTQSFVAEPIRSESELRERLPALTERWNAHVFRRDIPWHALERAMRGAYAALAGVEVACGAPAAWRGLALGDSCVVHLRGGAVIASQPIAASDAFTNEPVLISTDSERNAGLATELRLFGGELMPGDTLLLATDALAQFVLAAAECDATRIDALLHSLEDGDVVIEEGRTRGDLRNDDVAAIVIRVS
jgi:hypothetical protein